MRLNTKSIKSKSTKKKPVKNKKTVNKKGPKIAKNYNDTTEYIYDNVDIDLTQLTYGMIDSCDVDAVILEDGVIQIKDSWKQVLLIMIHNLLEVRQKDFKDILLENDITNQFFCIDRVYGKYSFSNNQFEAYKIYDTDYYLEAVFDSENIFRALVGLSSALDIKLDAIKFHLRNKNYKDLALNFDSLTETESVVNIDGVKDKLKKGIHMVAIEFTGDKPIKIHRIDVALVAICNWIYNKYNQLDSISSVNNTGIKRVGTELNTDIPSMKITGSDLEVYTDCNSDDIIDFIKNMMTELNIDKENIKFKFRALKAKNEIQPWEVD